MLGAGLVGLAGAWQVWGVRSAALSFRALSGAPGWSFAMSGGISGALDPTFVGIQTPDSVAYAPFTPDALQHAVYGDTRRSGHVPMAVFSDYFCPYCRVIFARLLNRLQLRDIPITVAWHELPLLRAESHFAARASVAAARQGGYEAFHAALIAQGLRPVPAAMGRLADQVGLDGARLIADMESASVAAQLAASARAAQQLGIFATPGVVIGQKVVLGALDAPQMEGLIAGTLAH